ncbi:ABC transporter ATP-binding protein [Thermopolyspora sp. NPDC052614]|uniref:ABC transporter ATP-binding protein n=1 Tax=Thermopolyspora sp. NPDC052614 TaxID=3155682 RepID=UPI003446B52B
MTEHGGSDGAGRKTIARLASALAMVWRAGPIWTSVTVVLSLTTSAVPVVAAWMTKLALDTLTGGGSLREVLPFAIGLAAVGLTTSALPAVQRYANGELERRIRLLAQDRLHAAVNRLPGLARFEDPEFLDRLRLAAQSGGATPGQVADLVLSLVGGLLLIGGFLGSLLTLGPVMVVMLLLGAVPALSAEIMLARQRAAMMWRLGPVERREFFYSQLMCSVEAAKEIRLFGLGGFFRQRMLRERREANHRLRMLERRVLGVQFGLGVLSATISGGGLVWAMAQAAAGSLTIGDVSMFIAAVAGVQSSLGNLVAQLGDMHRQLLLFDHYRGVITTTPDLPVRSLSPVPELREGIKLKNVWFRYSPRHPWVLRGVDLFIPAGASVGLVGVNGSGKSTLVKLLCRFYDPVQGAILWDGTDIRDFPPDELRQRISAVFQDYMQYDLTAAENIGLGDLELFDDRTATAKAAMRAGVHEVITRLPKGYDTLITRVFFQDDDASEGVFLSGGQSQRVSIARALLRGTRDLLIMDEPSSGLDAEAEHEIHKCLKDYRRNRTSLLISHRLGALRDADMLAVLDQGVIVELGTHDELMKRNGRYARLFAMQADGYREGR